MADAVLFGASAALTVCLPSRISYLKGSFKEIPSLSITLGLSLALFSLSILEVFPQSWRVLLAKEGESLDQVVLLLRRGFLTISSLYWIVLWGLCWMVMAILPATMGYRLLETSIILSRSSATATNPDSGQKKTYRRCMTWRNHKSWGMRFLCQCTLILVEVLKMFLCLPCHLLHWRKEVKRKNTEPILVVAVHENVETMRRVTTTSPLQNVIQYLTNVALFRKNYLIGSICGVASCWMVLSTLGPYVIELPPDKHGGTLHPLASLVSWLCAVGLLLSSVLNGFGSVALPHSWLVGVYLEPIRPEVLAKVEDDLVKTTSLLDAKRVEIANMMALSSMDISGSRRRLAPPPPRKNFSDFSEEYTTRRKQLYRELHFLEILCEELEEDVDDMKQTQSLAAKARTRSGQLRSWLGFMFSIVLVLRLVAATNSILRHYYPPHATSTLQQAHQQASTFARDDPITTCLLFLVGHQIVTQEDYIMLSQCISLLLTAILSFSQIQTFLKTVTTINRRLYRFYDKCDCKSDRLTDDETTPMVDHPFDVKKHGGAVVHTHLLAFVMGCYFLSCVVLLKLSLPMSYRSNFSAAMGGIEFQIQSLILHATFAMSAFVSAGALCVLFGIQRQSSKSLSNSTSSSASRIIMNDHGILSSGSLDSC